MGFISDLDRESVRVPSCELDGRRQASPHARRRRHDRRYEWPPGEDRKRSCVIFGAGLQTATPSTMKESILQTGGGYFFFSPGIGAMRDVLEVMGARTATALSVQSAPYVRRDCLREAAHRHPVADRKRIRRRRFSSDELAALGYACRRHEVSEGASTSSRRRAGGRAWSSTRTSIPCRRGLRRPRMMSFCMDAARAIRKGSSPR